MQAWISLSSSSLTYLTDDKCELLNKESVVTLGMSASIESVCVCVLYIYSSHLLFVLVLVHYSCVLYRDLICVAGLLN